MAPGTYALEAVGDEVTVVAPDRPGLLADVTGALALHRLDVRSASVFSDGPTGVTVCRVAPRFGALPDWAVVRRDLRRVLDGELDLAAVLAAREAAYAPRPGLPLAPPSATLLDDASATATVLEVRAPDALGVLHRITDALAALRARRADGAHLDPRRGRRGRLLPRRARRGTARRPGAAATGQGTPCCGRSAAERPPAAAHGRSRTRCATRLAGPSPNL